MIQKRCGLLWVLLLLLSVTGMRAQTTYPVQVNTHLLPPYSLYLSDYYSGTREKLTVTLINRDQFKPTLQVRLRMIITAPGGIRIQTNDNIYMEPITVETGSPVRLTQEDLAPYFRTDNLITQGFLTAGKLPEGMVEFCFQAIEAYTGQPLSPSTCTRAWITSQKPPLLSLPLNNENIAFREPLNMLFQWTPLHQGLALVEYEFILKELWDNGMAVQAAFAYSPEVYRETTRSTSLPYGALQPALLPGKRYAWCVRAQAREGMDAVNVFQNDGYTEVRTFTLQDNCSPPDLVKAVAERKTLQLEWPSLPEQIGFTVSYRLKSSTTTNAWKEVQTQDPKATLYGLQSGGVYEYRVGSFCIAGQPIYTPILEAVIPTSDSARLAQCGIMPAINLTNHEPVKELKTGEVIMANDYPVTITKISGGNGVYTGEGWVIVPWLNDAKIAVQFTSITVNTDKQMVNGYIDAKYDKNEGQIANLDEVFEGGFDVGTVKTGITKVDYEFDFSIPGVEAFSLNEEGDLVITDDTGEPHTVAPQDMEGQGNEGNKVVVFPMTVKDKNGNVYQVEKVTETDPATGEEKEVAKATFIGKAGAPLADGSFDPKQLDGDKAIVTFEKGEGVYAFDTWQDYYANVSLIKDKYGDELWDGYRAPWKFLPDGKSDVALARIVIKDAQTIKDPTKVIFKTPKGTEFTAEYNASDKTYKIHLAAGPVGDAQEVYALYPKGSDKYYTLGKLSLATYAAQAYTVVLVPVNDAPVDEVAIRENLSAIYGPIAITWTVKKDDSFAYSGNYRLMDKGTGLSTYNDDMRALNAQYRALRGGTFDRSANYLFFLKATGSDQINDRDLTGFMPRGAQFGYIFTSEIAQPDVPMTVAHELGHGRWKLFHTFDEHYGGYKRGETDNVMDYKNGRAIAKWQWDIIGDPAMLVSVFEGDDASAKGVDNYILTEKDRIFLSPAGSPIFVPKNSKIYSIATDITLWPDWAIYSFGYNADGRYLNISVGRSSLQSGTFFGYVNFSLKGATGDARYWTPNDGQKFHTGENTVTLIHKDAASCKMQLYEVKMVFTDEQLKGFKNGSRNTPWDDSKYGIGDLKPVDSSEPLAMSKCTKLSELEKKEFFEETSADDGDGSLVLEDYSNGGNGTSPFSQAELEKIKSMMEALAKKLGVDIKGYLLNTNYPSYEEIKKAYENDAAKRKVLVILDEDRREIHLEHKLTAPDWILEAFPNGPSECIANYVNASLDTLHKNDAYLLATLPDKVIMEYSVALYKGVFGGLYCAVDENAVKNASPAMKYVAGAVHEIIATVDVAEIVHGLWVLGKGIVKSNIDSYDSFIQDIKLTCSDLKNGKDIPIEVLATRLLPPSIRTQITAIKTIIKVSQHFVKFYFTGCGDMCPYRYGQFTVMIVPIVITGGEWAVAKGAQLMARLGKAGAKARVVTELVAEADRLGMRVANEVDDGTRASMDIVESVTDDAGKTSDKVVARVERNGDDVTISGDEPLVPGGTGVVEIAGLLARYPDLRFIYGGLKTGLGKNAMNFEKALKGCTDEVMAVFNKNPELMYKLGDIDGLAESVIKSRLDDIAKTGKNFGELKAGGGIVKGVENATLFSKINSGSLAGVKTSFDALDQAGKSVFLENFKNIPEANVAALADNGGELFNVWKTNRNVNELELLRSIRDNPALYAKLVSGPDLAALRPYFSDLTQADRSTFINNFKNATNPELLALSNDGGKLFEVWKVHKTVNNIDLLKSIETVPTTIRNHFQRRDVHPTDRDIKGCHDQTVWYDNSVVRQQPIGTPIPSNLPLTHASVPDILIVSDLPHPTIPGLRVIEYKVPAVNGARMTTGAIKNQLFKKTVYDPSIWTETKLTELGNDALIDAYRAGNILPSTAPSTSVKFWGMTRNGYEVEGYFDIITKEVKTFFFK